MSRFADQDPDAGRGPAGFSADRRRPSVRSVTFAPDPRRLRTLLAEVEESLGATDPGLVRRVRLLVGEIVARVLGADPDAEIRLELELKPDSVRIDIWQPQAEPCEFWDLLDDTVFSDLTSAWGRDRRRACGAWFELEGR
jgi:hypothetical protein